MVGVVVVDVLACVGLGAWFVWGAATGRMPSFFLFLGPSLVVSSAIAAWILLHSSYEIESGELVVRQGPNRRRIPVSSIDEVFPAKNNPLSPAWAGDRLQVMFTPETKPGTLFLQPEDREAFLRGLAEADSGLSYDGEKLTRSAPS